MPPKEHVFETVKFASHRSYTSVWWCVTVSTFLVKIILFVSHQYFADRLVIVLVFDWNVDSDCLHPFETRIVFSKSDWGWANRLVKRDRSMSPPVRGGCATCKIHCFKNMILGRHLLVRESGGELQGVRAAPDTGQWSTWKLPKLKRIGPVAKKLCLIANSTFLIQVTVQANSN